MLLWNLIHIPSVRNSLGLFPASAGSREMSRRASRKIDEGSNRARQSHAIGPSTEAKYDEPEWQGQWRTLKHL